MVQLESRYDTRWRDVTWKAVDGLELLARIYEPTGAGAPSSGRMAVVEVHGGAWCDNDRKAGTVYNKMLAASGVVVVAIDFRMGHAHKHPAGSDDVADAVRWTRARADELGVDPACVVLAGSSSGGHLAWLAALRMGAAEAPIGVIPLWPPTDPLARYRYACAKGDEHGARLKANTEGYFASEVDMADASIERTVRAGEAASLPPVFLVHPLLDQNVPKEITDGVVAAYREAGGPIDVFWVPDQHHGYGHTEGPATDELVATMRTVLASWCER